MKKLIAVLLAMLMLFSVVTVAFAADGDAEEPAAAAAEEESSNGTFDAIVKLLIGDGNIENVPIGTAKAGLKIAKIFLKLAKAFLKVGDALGIIDGDQIFLDLVNSIAGKLDNSEDTTTEPTSEAPAADPAA